MGGTDINNTEIKESKYFKDANDIVYKLLCELDRVCVKYGIKYQLACGTLLGAVRNGDVIPWDDDVDIYITKKELKKLLKHKSEFGDGFTLVMPSDYGKNVYYDNVVRLNYDYAYILPDDEKNRYYNGLRRKLGLDFFLLTPVPEGVEGLFHKLRLGLLYGLANSFRYSCILPGYGRFMRMAAHILYPFGKLIGLKRLRKAIRDNFCRYSDHDCKYVHVSNGTLSELFLLFKRDWFEETEYMKIREHSFPVPKKYHELLTKIYGDYMQLPPEDKRRWHFADPDHFVLIK